MPKKVELHSWSARQAVAILTVENIELSDFGRDVLSRIERGIISHTEAKEEILARARLKASTVQKLEFDK